MKIASRTVLLLLAVAASLPALATSFSSTSSPVRVTRLRLDSVGRAFVEVTPRPSPLDCTSSGIIIPSETYWFDATTLQGRILYNQVLSAYTTQSKVSGSGGGDGTAFANCLSFNSFPAGTFTRYEELTSLTVQQ